ncbi:hypothetical protein EZV61_14570 [Corallincola luteus]|uniref:Uncharacterized protein n=1 Tax=Corallincola luteus TaxID=1775177 RepID=A0ABY2AK65_9GAMM|nr:hypothetical protein [Corallincola luteus]TCI02160.1 hypothetical protein EZV61_14570 [Corallincola luteus]
MERNDIASAAFIVLSGAAAAMGPAGVPMFLLAASIGTVLNLYGGKEEDQGPPIEEVIDKTVSEHFVLNNARIAWSKIKPAYTYYESYVNRAEGGEEFSARDLDTLASAINDAIGPSSGLTQGLAMLYDERSPNDFGNVEYNLPIYMLGASLLIQYRLLDIAEQKFNGEIIVSAQWQQVRELTTQFVQNVTSIHRYVKSFTIEKILYDELNAGKLKRQSPELAARNDELQMHYLGGERKLIKYLYDLRMIEQRLRETA